MSEVVGERDGNGQSRIHVSPFSIMEHLQLHYNGLLFFVQVCAFFIRE